jgi:hypothetical protein
MPDITAPDRAVAEHLETELSSGSEEWTIGSEIFLGPVLPAEVSAVPAEAIFCLANGGPPPEMVLGEQQGKDFTKPLVQLWVRSETFEDAEGLARRVQKALHKAEIEDYLSCQAMQAQPIYMQKDGDGNHEFALNVELWVIE